MAIRQSTQIKAKQKKLENKVIGGLKRGNVVTKINQHENQDRLKVFAHFLSLRCIKTTEFSEKLTNNIPTSLCH